MQNQPTKQRQSTPDGQGKSSPAPGSHDSKTPEINQNELEEFMQEEGVQSLEDADSQILRTNQAENATMEIDEQDKILQAASQLTYELGEANSQFEASASQSIFETPKPAETIGNPADKVTTRSDTRNALAA